MLRRVSVIKVGVTKLAALAVVGAFASATVHAGEMIDVADRTVTVAAPVTRIVAACPPSRSR
jgi:hypothetical protein